MNRINQKELDRKERIEVIKFHLKNARQRVSQASSVEQVFEWENMIVDFVKELMVLETA
jgi:hypothetical protein